MYCSSHCRPFRGIISPDDISMWIAMNYEIYWGTSILAYPWWRLIFVHLIWVLCFQKTKITMHGVWNIFLYMPLVRYFSFFSHHNFIPKCMSNPLLLLTPFGVVDIGQHPGNGLVTLTNADLLLIGLLGAGFTVFFYRNPSVLCFAVRQSQSSPCIMHEVEICWFMQQRLCRRYVIYFTHNIWSLVVYADCFRS